MKRAILGYRRRQIGLAAAALVRSIAVVFYLLGTVFVSRIRTVR